MIKTTKSVTAPGATDKIIIQIASFLNVNLSSFKFPFLCLLSPYGRASDTLSCAAALSYKSHHSLKDLLNRLARRIDHDCVFGSNQRRISAGGIAPVALGDINQSLLKGNRWIVFTLFRQASFRSF